MTLPVTFPKQELIDLGFLCAVNGLNEECNNISNGLAEVYPDSPLPFLLKALALINNKQPLLALDLLQETALPLEPNNLTTKSLIGFAYIKSGHYEKGYSILKPIASDMKNDDLASRSLAMELLTE